MYVFYVSGRLSGGTMSNGAVTAGWSAKVGPLKKDPHVRGDHMRSYGSGIIWNHVGSNEAGIMRVDVGSSWMQMEE